MLLLIVFTPRAKNSLFLVDSLSIVYDILREDSIINHSHISTIQIYKTLQQEGLI